MKLANVSGRATIVVDGHALDVEQASSGAIGSDPMILCDLDRHDELRAVASGSTAGDWPVLDETLLGPPVPRPAKGFGVALNYRSHALESGLQLPDEPHLFAKTANCVCGPFDDIVVPAGRDRVDYEAEVVIVFGRACHAATPDDAWEHLAGVTCGQDISDRGEQFRPPVRQFTIAKSYDTFGPTGPYLVTPDELVDPDALPLEGRLNDETVQRSDTSD
ncbi:MAG: fumarylacetoacetate hydrolase family protein, partial [Ilumatobacteraceae bacterium]